MGIYMVRASDQSHVFDAICTLIAAVVDWNHSSYRVPLEHFNGRVSYRCSDGVIISFEYAFVQ
jgi:hypothetical protein